MNPRSVPVLAAMLAFSCSVPLFAQDAPSDMATPTPGPEHALLKETAGNWTFVNKFRMSPEMPWTETTGTDTVTVACGGFWQFSKTEGSMMGMPFEGRGSLGYDQFKKKYVGTWQDNFGSQLMVMEGDYDAKTKTLTMHSDMLDPQAGKYVKTKMVTEIKDADTHTFKMMTPGPDGKDFAMMEINYKRKK